MEKRFILFLFLFFALWVAYDYVLREMGITPPLEPPAATKPAEPPAEPASKPVDPSASPPAAAPAAQASTPERTSPTGPAEDRLETMETPLYRATFSTRGAGVAGWELERFMTGGRERAERVQLVHREGKFRAPLLLQSNDAELNKALAQTVYRVERDAVRLDAEHPTGHLTFTADVPGGRVHKRLTFHHDSYLVDIAVTTEGIQGPLEIGLGTNFGIVEWTDGFIGLIGPAVQTDGTLQKDLPDTEQEHKGPVRWVALQDKYFLSVLIPAAPAGAVVKKEGDKLASAAIRVPAGTSPVNVQLYAGPKEYDTLKSLRVGLEDTIDFGWFIYGSWNIVRAVAKPLFSILRFIYEYTHNYGIAIILLTVGIKLLFVPLQYKSYKSMKEMQVIQPKVLALQTKYKDDREKLNRELIKLYRDHKVNPVGGCLPMLLQTPVFVALFNILYMTIDLRQAPFFGWIHDLSVQDPYYVLPALMGLSMIVQQKIMPTTMDPTQAKIMLLLPLFLTFLFVTFPAGLVLYWLTNNLLTIAQQVITDRYIFKKPTFAAASDEGATADGAGDAGAGKKKKAPVKVETETP
jgi:YidC/Oxa1 family membrane protein insertase